MAEDYREQYLRHVAGQTSQTPLRSRPSTRPSEPDLGTGRTEVVLATQDRTSWAGRPGGPVSELVLAPTEDEPSHRVTDHGYIAAVYGDRALLEQAARDALLWHVVEVDPASGHLVAHVDEPEQVGERIYDLEQAMLDLLRHATAGAVRAALPDAAAAERGLARLTGQLAGGPPSPGFAADAAQVALTLADLQPALQWFVTRIDDDGRWTTVASAGPDLYPELAGRAVPWDDTICAVAARRPGATAAPDTRLVADVAGAPGAADLAIGCWTGVTLRDADGRPVGSICGMAPTTQPPETVLPLSSTLVLLARLLGYVHDAWP